MITVNGFKPLTIVTKSSTLDVAIVLDPPLKRASYFQTFSSGHFVSQFSLYEVFYSLNIENWGSLYFLYK